MRCCVGVARKVVKLVRDLFSKFVFAQSES
jgi:hypothetical protein